MKKILFLTGLVIWAVLGMSCDKKAEDSSAKNPTPNELQTNVSDEKAEDSSAKDPDPDRDGICSPWVSQDGVMDEYSSLCMGVDKCPDQAGSVDAEGCP